MPVGKNNWRGEGNLHYPKPIYHVRDFLKIQKGKIFVGRGRQFEFGYNRLLGYEWCWKTIFGVRK